MLAAGATPPADVAAALEDLCNAYWFPIYAFVRREGYRPADAQDLTQGFFAMLLQRGDLGNVRPEKGRFRSYLLGALKHFLINQAAKADAQKRGGGQVVWSFDFQSAESKYEMQASDPVTPESVFNRQWALALLQTVQDQLCREMSEAGKADVYDALHPFLVASQEAGGYQAAAERLGMTTAAIKMAMSRLRKRFRSLLRQEIAHTVSTEQEIDDEIRDLFDALRGPD